MFSFLKKTKQKIRDPSLNKELVDDIYNVINMKYIPKVIFDPCFKLYMINTFSSSFTELSSSYSDPQSNSTVAINLYSYFKGNDVEVIDRYFNNLVKYLPKNKIGIKYAHDLSEIVQSISFLGDNYVRSIK